MSDYIGKTIGDYQLVQFLSENDQTLLIKAFQNSMDRYVAVSLLKPHAAKDASVELRIRQAAAIAGTAFLNVPSLIQDDEGSIAVLSIGLVFLQKYIRISNRLPFCYGIS